MRFSNYSRETRPVAARIGQVLAADPTGLETARAAVRRVPATCRDYALMLCGLLREKSVPARVRCGFARYFSSGRFEDHWICEYHYAGTWRIADAQIDLEHRVHFEIDFDPVNVPRDRFWTARQAWQAWRAGEVDGAEFGHGDASGPHFLMVNLVRDFLALGGREVSEWDTWRQALPWGGGLAEELLSRGDVLTGAITEAERVGGMPQLPDNPADRALKPFW